MVLIHKKNNAVMIKKMLIIILAAFNKFGVAGWGVMLFGIFSDMHPLLVLLSLIIGGMLSVLSCILGTKILIRLCSWLYRKIKALRYIVSFCKDITLGITFIFSKNVSDEENRGRMTDKLSNKWLIRGIGLFSPTVVVPLLLLRGMKPIEAFIRCSIAAIGWSAFFLSRRITEPIMEWVGLYELIKMFADDTYFYGSLFILIGWMPLVIIILYFASKNKN